MGPFREIRMKKTAPRGSVKDKKDRASWTASGPDGSLQRNKDEKDRARWTELDDSTTLFADEVA